MLSLHIVNKELNTKTMDLRTYPTERLRITSDNKAEVFAALEGLEHDAGFSIDFYPRFYYVEIRKNVHGECKQFFFKNKRTKKSHDFGSWEDAEVIFSINNVIH
jgi:hypothetical protein